MVFTYVCGQQQNLGFLTGYYQLVLYFDYQLVVCLQTIMTCFFVADYQVKGTVGCSMVLKSDVSMAAGCYHLFGISQAYYGQCHMLEMEFW
jgi:hypothetical protein